MRRALSASVLVVATVASVATSKTPTTTTTGALRGPSADLAPNLVESFTVDVLASQSPAGPFDGAVMVSASATATGAATVTATLSVRDAGGTTELATDTVVLAGGSDDLFLYDDLDAFAGCAAGATCDQTFVLTLHTTGLASVDWDLEADLYDLDDIGRTGDLELFLR